MCRCFSLAVFLLAGGLGAASPLWAQGISATVRGRVVGSGGSGLPHVVLAITSRNQPSGNKTVVTDIEGNFRIFPLPPANDYYIKINYPGYTQMVVGPLDLDPGRTTVQDIMLPSDAESVEIIEVVGTGDPMVSDDTRTATSFDHEFIEGLPNIGHAFQELLTLAPGVTDVDGDGNPNVHGSRDTGLQINLDGANITDPVSGTFGQNLNQDIIEEIEIITAGAPADNGRADGGFVNIITKSGGNDFDGKFSIFWQGRHLNGDGANNNDTNKFDSGFPGFRDIRPSLSLGGAIIRDNLWYFGSVQFQDRETPVNQVGANILVTARGNNFFGKLTWQASSSNKLALQFSSDPLTFRGLGLALGTSPQSDFQFAQGGITPHLKWTSTISPQLLLEAGVTHFKSGISLTPVSSDFEPTEVERQVAGNTIQTLYPCEVLNCNPARGEKKIFQRDIITGAVTGPFNISTNDSRIRNAIRTDLSYILDEAWGQHSLKSGIEFADEKFFDSPITNPLLIDVTRPFQPPAGSTGTGGINSDLISGAQVLQTFDPLRTPQRASSFNSGFFILDAWKPLPNLTINAGMRLDREDVDTSGFDFFDPRQERGAAVGLWRTFCAEARAQGLAGATSNCNDPATFDGKPPTNIPDNALRTDRDGDGVIDISPRVASLDLNGDGVISTAGNSPGSEGFEFYKDFTRFVERETSNFEIVNNNLSPRFSVSWDPWADGRTKLFGTWSRFYDRLFLATVTGEIGPDNVNFAFLPDQNHVIIPRAISKAASTVSITQVDRDLRTPYTDELSLGIERELAPEWSVGLTYIRRRGYDLLQDIDINHITCRQHGDVIGISPQVICGDAGTLEEDRFGAVGFEPGGTSVEGGQFSFNRSFSLPNGAPDLYTVSNGFNQVLRIGNFNRSAFEAYELKILKRLHRNWQMQGSYTWSQSFGQAEAFGAVLGNDPETVDDEEGYLSFDQRHILKFQAVARLSHDISLGTVMQWASGTPYSITQTTVDQDSTGNTIFRRFFPTRQRNDQRNEGQWRLDGRIEKNFRIGTAQAAGFLSVQNLLNSDDLTITSYDLTALDGVGLNATRDFGRRFELGASFSF